MAGRTVGKGRGSVFASNGVRYDEGAEIPKDVAVDDFVFTDADEGADVGNPAAVLPQIVTAEDTTAKSKSSSRQSS